MTGERVDKATQFKIISLIQSAVDLALTVGEDYSQDGIISEETVQMLAEFTQKHNELSEILDLENADNGGKYEN